MNAIATPETKPRAAQSEQAKATKDAKTVASAEAVHIVKPVLAEKASLKHFKNNSWLFILEPGTTPDDLESPKLCDLVASDLTRLDDVRLVAADSSFFADAICVDKGPGGALLKVIRFVDLPNESPMQEKLIPDGFSIVKSGIGDEQPGYRVIRLADNVCLNIGQFLTTFESARRYLLDHSSLGSKPPSVWRG